MGCMITERFAQLAERYYAAMDEHGLKVGAIDPGTPDAYLAFYLWLVVLADVYEITPAEAAQKALDEIPESFITMLFGAEENESLKARLHRVIITNNLESIKEG